MNTNKDITHAVSTLSKIMSDIEHCDYFKKCEILAACDMLKPVNITNGRGSVFLYDDDFILKIFSERALREMAVDTPFLKALQGEFFVPVLYGFGHDYVVMENISEPGVLFLADQILKSHGDDTSGGMKAVDDFLDEVIRQFKSAMHTMLLKQVLYSDMKLYSHFRWNEKDAVLKIIDYGNCVFTRNDDTGPPLMDILLNTGNDDDAELLIKGRNITPKTPAETEDIVRGRSVFLRQRFVEYLKEGRIRD